MALDGRSEHRVDVELTTSGSGTVELWMPVWTPGAYELRTWGRNVTVVSARDGGGRALAWARTGPSTFRVDGAAGTVKLHYRVYAPRLTDDGSHVDGAHALLNGSSVFLAVRGQEKGRHEVHVALPGGWHAAGALDEDGDGWKADGYEALIDGPIECGRFAEATTRAAGRSYRLVVDGASSVPPRFAADVARLAAAEARLAGTPPYRRYTVFVHLADEPGRVAALEHAAATSIIVPRRSLVDKDGYDELRYVVAHELFHAWNAKRLRPAELVPYDLSRPQTSRALWITEGLTDYYAHRAMLLSGRWTRADWLEHTAEEAEHAVSSARLGRSLEEASELSWQPPDDADGDWDAYYARGHLVALALDASIRVATSGKRSLDDAMRALLAAAERRGGVLPVDTAALAQAIDLVAPGVGDKALAWARHGDEIEPLRAALAAIGLDLRVTVGAPAPFAGFAAARDGALLRVVAVAPGSPADLAGLHVDDRITALDGAAPGADWTDAITRQSAGSVVVLSALREDRRLQLRLTLGTRTDVACKLVQAPATPAVTRLRDALLSW